MKLLVKVTVEEQVNDLEMLEEDVVSLFGCDTWTEGFDLSDTTAKAENTEDGCTVTAITTVSESLSREQMDDLASEINDCLLANETTNTWDRPIEGTVTIEQYNS